MTDWDIIKLGITGGLLGGCTAFALITLITCLALLYMISRAPQEPEEEFINDHLIRQRYGNGRIQPNQTTEEK